MQLELTKETKQPLKIFIYKDQANLLVANLAYSVDESMKDLLVQKNVFTFLGTLNAAEVVSKLKLTTDVPSPFQVREEKEMKKSEFLFSLMYTADKFVVDPKDQKTLKRIINKITLL